VSWWNLLAVPIAGILALAYGRRVFFWCLVAFFFGFWSLLIVLLPRKELKVPTLPNWLLVLWGNRQIARIMRPIRDPSDLF
jgi:hypothetical protein